MPGLLMNPLRRGFSLSGAGMPNSIGIILIPPYPGPAYSPPYLYNAQALYAQSTNAVSPTRSNWLGAPGFGIARLTTLQLIGYAAVINVWMMRPFNWTYFRRGLAPGTVVLPNDALVDDPGLYSVNYKYATPGAAVPAQVDDAPISGTNMLCCYQFSDGTWQVDSIASGAFGANLSLSKGTPNRPGAAILPGSPFFYFGGTPGTLLDPATGLPAQQFLAGANQTNVLRNYLMDVSSAVHAGDPLLLYATPLWPTDIITAAGYYAGF